MEEEQLQEQTNENGQSQENYADGNVEMESQDNSNAEQGGGDGNEDDDDRKLFVGGLSWETTQKDMQEYFEKFGKVSNCVLKTDMDTRRSRGFGFVVFEDTATVEKVLEEKNHRLHGRTIDPKKANPRGGKDPQRKVYVGKVNPSTTEETLREYFEKYGKVTKVELPYNKNEEKRRDFVFVEFEKEETVQQVLGNHKVGDNDQDAGWTIRNRNWAS